MAPADLSKPLNLIWTSETVQFSSGLLWYTKEPCVTRTLSAPKVETAARVYGNALLLVYRMVFSGRVVETQDGCMLPNIEPNFRPNQVLSASVILGLADETDTSW